MAWIPVVDAGIAASPALNQAYAAVAGRLGTVANIMAVHSVHPEAMMAHLRFYLALMFSASDLTRAERELIAVAVSRANACEYCVSHHASSLRHLWPDDARVGAAAANPANARLDDDRQRVLVAYAMKLTRSPAEMQEDDVARLRTAGVSERGIHDVVAITAYFNFVNRLALGLGVELEPEQWDAAAPPAELR